MNIMKSLTKLTTIVGLASAMIALTACKSPGPFVPKTPKNTIENTEPFVLLDRGAARSVTCTQIQKQVLEDGRLQVTANVRNLESRRIQVQINCEFKDAQGFPVDSTPFRTVILDENAQEGVRFVSLSDQARNFTIRVRQAR